MAKFIPRGKDIHTQVLSLDVLSCLQLFTTPWTVAYQTPLSMDSAGKDTGMKCHFLLQGIFPTQGSNLCLLCLVSCVNKRIICHWCHLGSTLSLDRWYKMPWPFSFFFLLNLPPLYPKIMKRF